MGLGISSDGRLFVGQIDAVNNRIVLCKEALKVSNIHLYDVVFSGMKEPDDPITIDAEIKVRYQARPISATVSFLPDCTASVVLSEPARSVAPGQTAVIYDGDSVLASGFIV